MNINIFTLSEMITIIMALIEDIDMEEKYGISSEDINFPNSVRRKLSNLGSKDYGYFMEVANEIAKECYEHKTGELSELNNLHREISILSESRLSEYII